MSNAHTFSRYLLCLFICSLICLCTACGQTSSTVPTTKKSIAPTPALSTDGITITRSFCPVSGTANVATMPPLTTGNHQTVIFNTVHGYNDRYGPTSDSIISRYDILTGMTHKIVELTHEAIFYAQVSTDGQWVLFLSLDSNASTAYYRLHIVRIDGQFMQTLFCSDLLNSFSWSPDQKHVLLTGENWDVQKAQNIDGLFLLTLSSGTLQQVTTFDTFNYVPSSPWTWLNASQVVFICITGHYDRATGIDTTKRFLCLYDFQQPFPPDTKPITTMLPYTSAFSTSLDSSHIYMNEYQQQETKDGMVAVGPSSVHIQSVSGGPQTTLYKNATMGIVRTNPIANSRLMLVMHNPADTYNLDELWVINTDGTGLKHLATDDFRLNLFSTLPWSNTSRDGTLYSLWVNLSHDYLSSRQALTFASFTDNRPVTFAQATNHTDLEIIGWTSI